MQAKFLDDSQLLFYVLGYLEGWKQALRDSSETGIPEEFIITNLDHLIFSIRERVGEDK